MPTSNLLHPVSRFRTSHLTIGRCNAPASSSAQGVIALAKEGFLAPVHIQELKTEQLSWQEAKDISRSIREAGKAVDNQSMLDEMRDREAFLDQKKKTRRDRQKDEQATLPRSPKPVKTVEPDATQTSAAATPSEPDLEIPQLEIWDFDED